VEAEIFHEVGWTDRQTDRRDSYDESKDLAFRNCKKTNKLKKEVNFKPVFVIRKYYGSRRKLGVLLEFQVAYILRLWEWGGRKQQVWLHQSDCISSWH